MVVKTRGSGRLGLAEEVAQVEEVLLGGGALGKLGSFPLGDELLRRHEDCGSGVGYFGLNRILAAPRGFHQPLS